MKPVIVQAEAEGEIDAGAWHYETQRVGSGQRFGNAIRASLALIQRFPLLGTRYRRTPFRFQRVQRFPYVIYYADLPQFVWVVAVAHGRQRPGYWLRRRLDP